MHSIRSETQKSVSTKRRRKSSSRPLSCLRSSLASLSLSLPSLHFSPFPSPFPPEAATPSPAPAPPLPLLAWSSPAPSPEPSTSPTGWDAVWALEDQQRRRLHRIWERGVAWKPSSPGAKWAAPVPVPVPALAPVVFRLDHGGEVDADGNCLFTAARTAAAAKADARELRHRAVRRFAEVYTAAGEDDKAAIDAAVRHL